MAYERILDSINVPANSDLNSHQFKFMKYTSGKLTVCTAAGERTVGLLSNDPNTDEGSLVVKGGIAKCLLGGSVTQGDLMTTDADGKGITVADRGDYIACEALETGVTGDIIPVYVTPVAMREGPTVGTIQLPLAQARELSSDDIINAAGVGGILSKDSTPNLEAINTSTDRKLQLEWAASNNDAICWDFVLPADLDDEQPITLHALAKMGGATNTPTLTWTFFAGIGDTNAGGATAALSATLAEKTVSIAAADVPAAPNAATVTLAPGAHTTDTVVIIACWAEYTRK